MDFIEKFKVLVGEKSPEKLAEITKKKAIAYLRTEITLLEAEITQKEAEVEEANENFENSKVNFGKEIKNKEDGNLYVQQIVSNKQSLEDLRNELESLEDTKCLLESVLKESR